MRDDIHKSAPVGRLWQTVIKHCNREADRKERAAKSVLRAIQNDCSREIPRKLVGALKAQCSSGQGSLFGNGVGEMISLAQQHACDSALANDLIVALQAVEESCNTSKEALDAALKCVAQDKLDAKRRAINGHLQTFGAKESEDLVRIVDQIVGNCPVEQVVKKILDDCSENTDAVDNDENLL